MKETLGAGALDRRITIQVRAESKDDIAAASDEWTNLYRNLPAEYIPKTSREYGDSLKTYSELTVAWRIRWIDGLDSSMHRIVYEAKTFNIFQPLEIGRRHWLLIPAVEIK